MSLKAEENPFTGSDEMSEDALPTKEEIIQKEDYVSPKMEMMEVEDDILKMKMMEVEEATSKMEILQIEDATHNMKLTQKEVDDDPKVEEMKKEEVTPIIELSQKEEDNTPKIEISQEENLLSPKIELTHENENVNPKMEDNLLTPKMEISQNENPAEVAPTSVIMVEEPNTIIELVDLYVPPVSCVPGKVFFMKNDGSGPLLVTQTPQIWFHNSTLFYNEPAKPAETSTRGTRGRKRGRKPADPNTRPGRRRRRVETPPPLPPPPNYLAHCINPLENEIYPKVIVQPAYQPWVLPKNLNGGDSPPPPPTPPEPKVEPKKETVPVSGAVTTNTTQTKPAISMAQLRQKLQLFGPNVTIFQFNGKGTARFKAILKENNGNHRQLVFSADQLLSFGGTFGPMPMKAPITMPKPTPAMVSHYFPGPGGQILANKMLHPTRPVVKNSAVIMGPPLARPPRAVNAKRENSTYLYTGPPKVSNPVRGVAPSGVSNPVRGVAPSGVSNPVQGGTSRVSSTFQGGAPAVCNPVQGGASAVCNPVQGGALSGVSNHIPGVAPDGAGVSSNPVQGVAPSGVSNPIQGVAAATPTAAPAPTPEAQKPKEEPIPEPDFSQHRIALPAILKRQSQMKLLKMLQAKRAKKAAEEAELAKQAQEAKENEKKAA
ncbi:uncharacterized protein LOC108103570 [Drosophila eugracilis]|uniref:uncharacterized protein LOC108103570 n=1 Tax=Drosophila eugracilis TaxID=29029 RepID=UPI0007E6CBDB|nr:uncharacterized protein LOC108103570 [Drosophila eugracilis]